MMDMAFEYDPTIKTFCMDAGYRKSFINSVHFQLGFGIGSFSHRKHQAKPPPSLAYNARVDTRKVRGVSSSAPYSCRARFLRMRSPMFRPGTKPDPASGKFAKTSRTDSFSVVPGERRKRTASGGQLFKSWANLFRCGGVYDSTAGAHPYTNRHVLTFTPLW